MSASVYAVIPEGDPGDTFEVDAAATAKNVVTDGGLDMQNAAGRNIKALVVNVQTEFIRWTLGSTPTTGAAGLGVVSGGGQEEDILVILGAKNIRAFNYINYVGGATARLMLTPIYNER